MEYAAKPATVGLLLAAALALHPVSETRRDAFAVALALSLAGDVFLMLPSDAFVLGLGSFLLAHVAYIAGFIAGGDMGRVGLPVAAASVAVAGAAAGGRIVIAMQRTGGNSLILPVVVYMLAISTMTTCALATGRVPAALGGVLFFVSDSLIAENRFVRPLRWAPVAIIVTYHLAQTGLVWSLAA